VRGAARETSQVRAVRQTGPVSPPVRLEISRCLTGQTPCDQGSLTSLTAVSPEVSVSLTRQRVFRHAQMRHLRETSCNDGEPGTLPDAEVLGAQGTRSHPPGGMIRT
jgi:hypothetical protein